ncbi:MAG: exodeoxyribonuclease III [Tissierellia bacterium]|nr:exodeoxyribonuclease III [Tissierellia bacterium]
MKLISWNVNGLRAVLNKNFLEFIEEENPDVLCLQEIKAQEDQLDLDLPGYHVYWNSAQRKGYSGTMTLSKIPALSVRTEMGDERFDHEGRVLTTEFEDYFIVNVYTPNSKRELQRLDERMEFEDLLREYLSKLREEKPVILCGDLNVAHRPIDLNNPDNNRRSAGFTNEERERFDFLLEAGFIDTFRHFYPDTQDAYSWWSYITRARSRNAGWRIDYFVVSEEFLPRIKDAGILSEVLGSDHCPVSLHLH